MKKTILSALMLATLFTVKAQTVTEDSFSRLAFSVKTPSVAVDGAVVGSGKYLQPVVEGYSLTGNVGDPALPVLTQTIVLPFCSDMSISVSNAVYDTIQADASLQWYPYQPSVSKSDRGPLALYFNKDSYLLDTFFSLPLVQVTDIAVARDRRIATLTIAPVSLNPVTNQYIVCRSADVSIDYHGVDTAMTNDYYERYHTPSFSVNGKFNDLADVTSTKAIRHSAPVRMVVAVPASLNCSAVARFVDWKRRCGMLVDVVYYGTGSMTSNTALANHFKSLYDNASSDAPAPTYILLIGDHAQLPAFSSRLNTSSVGTDHITDLYYVTWTSGDIVPDCYQGRLSASDTNTLTSIINKTLFYETYSFTNDSYLAKAVLISGVDRGVPGDNAYTCADPTMDYAARYYINEANGFTTVKYYKNNTSFAPDSVTVTGSSGTTSSAATIRNLYTSGYGWINYSAHGEWDRWHQPQMTVTQVNSMNNYDKPSIMIGNCCLTNKFEKPTCFGEALLRRPNNAGAVAYIGGTNSTYWYEDFYWSVGVRSRDIISNTMNATYNASRLGVYDRLFHTHGESRANQAATVGAMVFYGNNSVNSSSSISDMKKYYWEIYELMGDPSLMPWLGKAKDLTTFSYAPAGTTIYVTTVSYAYVALVDTATHNLVAAAYATLSGNANLTVPEDVNLEACSFVVIAQGYKPYFSVEMQPLLNLDKVDAEFSLYPNPASDRCTVVADSIATVVLLDNRGTVVSTFKPAGNTCDIDLSALPRGIYFVQVQTADNMSARKLVVR